MAALAGYGIGARLEYMIGPVAFGIGSGLTTLVGVAAGANAWQRAMKVAWTGALIAFAAIGLIGWLVALFPQAWARLFTSDAAGRRSHHVLHRSHRTVLLHLWPRHHPELRKPGRGPHDRASDRKRRADDHVNGRRWLVVEKTDFGLGGLFAAIALGIVVYGCVIPASLLVAPWRGKAEGTL